MGWGNQTESGVMTGLLPLKRRQTISARLKASFATIFAHCSRAHWKSCAVYTPCAKKNASLYFINNFVKPRSILVIFGTTDT